MELYKIDEAIEAFSAVAVDEDGVINEEIYAEIEKLQIAREVKLENIACLVKNKKAEAAALKAEAKTFQARAKAAESTAEWAKDYLAYYLKGEKFSTTKCAVSFRRTISVECDDIKSVPDQYLRVFPPELDKTAAGAALKAGEEVPGCHLVEKESCTVR